MNNKPLAGLALVILLAMPLSALAEATAGEAVWTPPVVTAEEMEAARLWRADCDARTGGRRRSARAAATL